LGRAGVLNRGIAPPRPVVLRSPVPRPVGESEISTLSATPATFPAAASRNRTLRLHGTIAQDIGTAILSGRYRPGDLLANEVQFSEQLQVSRTAYREAVRILAAKGFVSSRPKAGTRINPRANWNFLDPDVLKWVFETDPVSPSFVRELFELRQIVEPSAAALAAKRRDPQQLATLDKALRGMEAFGLAVEDGRSADRLFHETILQATGNEALGTLASGISAAVRWTTLMKARTGRLPRDPVPEHRRVYEAIEAADPDAAFSAMKGLVGLALQDITTIDPRIEMP